MLRHLPEYVAEALCLGLFMISAGVFCALLESPDSPLHLLGMDSFSRRMVMGIAMGVTAVVLIYSPLGKRSGAHMNPAVTLSFFNLGKITRLDLLGYVAAQFLGGVFGVYFVWRILGTQFSEAPVNFVATQPGRWGNSVAFVAEVGISFLLFSTVLVASNSKRWASYTGIIAGALVALFITFEAPLSGMSMNPARSFASAFPPGNWSAFWIYLFAPPIGMLIASNLYKRRCITNCAKLVHSPAYRCIFCGYQPARREPS